MNANSNNKTFLDLKIFPLILLAFVIIITGAFGFLISYDIFTACLLLSLIVSVFFFILRPQLTLFFFGCFLLFQHIIIEITKAGVIRNIDEVIILFFFLVMIFRKILKKELFHMIPVDMPLFGVIVIGSISSIMSGKVSMFVASSGLLLLVKGFLLFYIFANTSFREKDISFFMRTFLVIGLFIALCGLLGFLSPYAFGSILGINPEHKRFGFIAAQSLLRHPGAFAALMAILACYSISAHLINGHKKFLYISIFFIICIIFSFRRTSLFGIILAPLIGIIYSSFKNIRIKGGRIYFVAMFVLILSLSGVIINLFKNLFISYFFLRNTPREMLTLAGIRISLDYFPLGSGFGTFGGWMSRLIYSPLYYEYGLSRTWGLSPKAAGFLNDTFWPHILAEIGVFGLLFYLLIIVGFFRICIKALTVLQKPILQIFALGTFMLLIESLVESTKATFYEISLWTYFYFGSIGILWSLVCMKVKEEGLVRTKMR